MHDDAHTGAVPNAVALITLCQRRGIDGDLSALIDKETKQLLADYKLIQYDITAGKNYLKDTDFMTLP